MDELTVTTPFAGDGLSSRAATIAQGIADVLEQRCSAASGAVEAAAFVREWADSACSPITLAVTPFDRLAARFCLTERECDLVLLAGLPEEHEGIATTFRSIHPQGEPRPTVGLAALLSGGTALDRAQLRDLLSSGAAVRAGLLQVVGPGPFFERSLTLPDGLWAALHGHDAWPIGLARVRLDPPPVGLDGWVASRSVIDAAAVLRDDRRAVVVIISDDESVGRSRCSALAAAAGRTVCAARLAPEDSVGVSVLAAHAAVRGALPMLVVPAGSEGSVNQLSFGDFAGAVLVSAAPGLVRGGADRAMMALSVGRVDAADQQAAWRAAIPALAAQAPALASRHPLDPAITAQLGIDVTVRRQELTLADVSALIRARAAASLPAGVELVTPNVAWSQIVLPPESGMQLRDAVARLDHQDLVLDEWELRDRAHASRGARLLLTGPPGTGKSLAAAAVATAAQTDLLVVDISRIVSKWLGETEKNLAAAFEAAERTQAVLLLDEADALFAARTEISDAHDRYANLETAYLLQRLDRFDGIAILTTNLRANIDAAFMRRMDYVVEFPLPDVAGRTDLWAGHLPTVALSDDIDTDALARLYPVPGAWIRNAAVAAAFAAAAAGSRIDQKRLIAAMRREYAKASLPFPGEPPRRRNDPV